MSTPVRRRQRGRHRRQSPNPPAGIPSTIQPGTIAGHTCGAACCDLRYEPTGRWLRVFFAASIAEASEVSLQGMVPGSVSTRLETDSATFGSGTLDGVDQAMETHRGSEIRVDALF